jgi:hypothetical protein
VIDPIAPGPTHGEVLQSKEMNPQTERNKFQAQFTQDQWSSLLKNADIKQSWESGDFVKAGELTHEILYGTSKNWNEARATKKLIDKYVYDAEKPINQRKKSG